MTNTRKPFIHPYIPNSVPRTKQEMLKEVGAGSIEELFEAIPERLRSKGKMNLPEPILSEHDLRRHVEELLSRNQTTDELISFLGAGCYNHFVPSICDEVNSRGEFLTAYAGEPYDDHGRFQALFEYTSMMAELLNMEVVNVPTYDGFQAAATSLRMACRIYGRNEVLLPATISPDKRSKILDYLKPEIKVEYTDYAHTGLLDLEDLKRKISEQTAAVYLENPGYLGILELHAEEIGGISHQNGAVFVVSVDPISLGVLAPPADYGADIVCGDIQSLGMHMNYGGGQAGFIATRDEEKYVMQYPSRLFGIAPTEVEGEYGFGDVAYERTSFAIREEGNEWVGTAAALWGITAGVYLALMGPQGMREVGEAILSRTRYAMQVLGRIKGIRLPFTGSPSFREFVVNFDESGKTVQEINKALLSKGILGGKDLTKEFPALGNSALYCFTETTSQVMIDRHAAALEEIL
ncbi:MAG: aminomethyl-transferring glycine dehydrogenase subunit GcvPA [Chloroflexi bacterium]|nr:MAG: aminomethyl-transferring glycine dehydrogenase subunit GcvPA [Chloroflexota bacterium]